MIGDFNTQPLTPEMIEAAGKYYLREKCPDDVLDIFINNLFKIIMPFLTPKEMNRDVRQYIKKMVFDSIDHANLFLQRHMEFYNSTVRLLEEIQNPDEYQIPRIVKIACALLDNTGKPQKAIADLLVIKANEMMGEMFFRYSIDLNTWKSEDYMKKITEIAGEHLADITLRIIDYTISLRKKIEKKHTGLILCTLIQLAAALNKKRKEKFVEAMAADKARSQARPGRNDPCICGSGKKYKNCCLKKQGS